MLRVRIDVLRTDHGVLETNEDSPRGKITCHNNRPRGPSTKLDVEYEGGLT